MVVRVSSKRRRNPISKEVQNANGLMRIIPVQGSKRTRNHGTNPS